MNLSDYELRRPGDRPGATPPPPRAGLVVAALLVLALVALGGAYWYLWRRPAAQPAAKASPPAAASHDDAPAAPLGGQPEAIDVPPLDQSDPIVQELVRTLSTHPSVVAWLATNGLIRNFTVVVDNIASGQTPAKHLKVLRPSSGFTTIGQGPGRRIDPRSYDRYNAIADAVASVDAQGAARVYATLKPRIEEANSELGAESFDRKLEQAMVLLIRTNVPEGSDRVEPKGGEAYQFADPRLESLSNAQKLLLRMGPRNAHIVQNKLREIALALGIPPERL